MSGADDTAQHYTAFISLAIHGQENKWWMLYIYLMFNSILVLGCVGLFVANDFGLSHRLALSALCLAGLAIGLSWFVMGPDYADASDLYGNVAVAAERQLRVPNELRPLTRRADQRGRKFYIGTTRFVAALTPALFIGVYLVFLTLAWCRPNTALERAGGQSDSRIERSATTGRSTPRYATSASVSGARRG